MIVRILIDALRGFSAAIITIASILPANAYEGHFGPRNSVNAGIRFSVPFGPTKKSTDRIRYGFHMALHREFNSSTSPFNYPQTFKADLASLNFSENGFKGLSFVGQDILINRNGTLEVVNFKKKKGIYYGGLALGVILGGVAVAGGFVLLVSD